MFYNDIHDIYQTFKWRDNMETSVTQLLEKLKQGAVDRCRERVLQAAKKPKVGTKEVARDSSQRAVTAHLKERRGL